VQGLDSLDIGGFKVPDNVDFIKCDLFEGLPFPDSSIDFVHQRMMKAIYPTIEIPNILEDFYRVLKPGGWLEIVEPEVMPRRGGPLITKLFTQGN
jgi:ubiquinone/menaquinone biosynthesis C-methylase UbiE